jgi:hypothetical protein
MGREIRKNSQVALFGLSAVLPAKFPSFMAPDYSQIQDLIVSGFAHEDPEVKERAVSLTLEISQNYWEVNSRELSM